jgi:hypothetical protein
MCGNGWLEELEGAVPRKYRDAYQRACEIMEGRDPRIDAETAGVPYIGSNEEQGRFEIRMLNRDYHVSWPDLEVREVGRDEEPSYVVQLLLLHYLITSDGISLRNQWISFRDLPDGRVYYPAFREGSEAWLLSRFGSDPGGLDSAATALGGESAELGDRGYVFWAFPRLPIAVLLWEGDDEFPPEMRILFDATAPNYLPTEDLAVIARYLTACLVRSV